MFKDLADFISLKLTTNKIIDVSDREAYTYGLELLLLKTVFNAIIIIIAILTKSIVISTLFLLFFLSLRQYTGGYHCKSSGTCLMVSLLIYLMMLFFERADFECMRTILLVTAIISFIIVLIFSPIENANNPITKEEKYKYKIISVIISISLIIIISIAIFYNMHTLFYASSWSLSVDAVLIILTKRRKYDEKHSFESNC